MKTFKNNDTKQLTILDERFYVSEKNPDVYFPSVTTILETYPKGFGFNEWLKSVGHNAEEIVRKAGEKGSNVHDMIDRYLKGELIKWDNDDGSMHYALDEWVMFDKFVQFWTKYKPKVFVHEFSLCSDTLGFGGTIDLICKLNKLTYLIDYKSSNAIHKTHELQLSAYAMLWNECNPKYKIDRTAILWLNAATRGEDKQGKKIQGQGWQLKDDFGRPWEEAYKVFEHTHSIWKEENPGFKPKNLTYPTEFQLTKGIRTLKELLKDETKKD